MVRMIKRPVAILTGVLLGTLISMAVASGTANARVFPPAPIVDKLPVWNSDRFDEPILFFEDPDPLFFFGVVDEPLGYYLGPGPQDGQGDGPYGEGVAAYPPFNGER